jgi:hypothetical protein
MSERKPLFLLGGGRMPTLEEIAAASKVLTGRDATPEEMEEARTILEGQHRRHPPAVPPRSKNR